MMGKAKGERTREEEEEEEGQEGAEEEEEEEGQEGAEEEGSVSLVDLVSSTVKATVEAIVGPSEPKAKPKAKPAAKPAAAAGGHQEHGALSEEAHRRFHAKDQHDAEHAAIRERDQAPVRKPTGLLARILPAWKKSYDG